MQYFWSVKESIKHSGVIDKIENRTVYVKIVQVSACSGCQAKSLCRISEMKEKIVEVVVDAPERYSVGQVVTVLGTTSQGAKAVALAFGLPLFILGAKGLQLLKFLKLAFQFSFLCFCLGQESRAAVQAAAVFQIL